MINTRRNRIFMHNFSFALGGGGGVVDIKKTSDREVFNAGLIFFCPVLPGFELRCSASGLNRFAAR